MKVNILTTDNFISYYFFYPLLVNKRRLRELNIILKYYEKVREAFMIVMPFCWIVNILQNYGTIEKMFYLY